MRRLHKDFETASALDLLKVGTHNYAQHWSTHIICMSYAWDNEPPRRWFPGQPYPADVAEHEAAGGIVVAYNAAFEYEIHNVVLPRMVERRTPEGQKIKYGNRPLTHQQLDCVMARANAMALPPKLEKVAIALGLSANKDMEGNRLMKQMCKPKPLPRGVVEHPKGWTGIDCTFCNGHGVDDENNRCNHCAGTGEVYGELYEWWREPEKIERLAAYCDQDVIVEQAVDRVVYQLSPSEQIAWRLDQEINRRGLPLDIALAERITKLVEVAHERLDLKMQKITNREVKACTAPFQIKKFLETHCGIVTESMDKEAVQKLLDAPGLPKLAEQVLLLRQAAAKSSVAKFDTMLEAVSRDGWVRGMFNYHAATTGRWGGRKVQMQNLVRWPKWFKMRDVDVIINVIMQFPPAQAVDWIEVFYDDVLQILPYLLRPTIRADRGHVIYSADAANIEGRGLAWLAGEQWKLDAFAAYDAGTGPDLYKVMAASVIGKPIAEVDDDERQGQGKVPELACGYGGGVGAFQNMAKVYGVTVSNETADRVKVAWREKNPCIVDLWGDLEGAAIDAVRHPGEKFKAGAPGRQTTFLRNETCLRALLPSGRVLVYMYPSVKERETPWGSLRDAVHFWAWDSEKNRWAEDNTYGGKLSENVTQAICRDLLLNAMLNVRKAGFSIILHVHDEVVVHVPKGHPTLTRDLFARECSRLPAWAYGLPLVFKANEVERYSK